MRLLSIGVRNFKGIREARFDHLSETLCLFYGPNESGKSTLVEALHFALFETASGSAEHKRALRSWGGTSAPEVEVAFIDHDNREWFVHKRFLDRPTTTVDVGSQHLSGAAAEQKLRDLFRTKKGTSRGVTPKDLGIWPLLWVKQGESGRPTKEAMNHQTRAQLHQSLSSYTGMLAAGPQGRAALSALEQRKARFLTGAGRPTGELKALRDQLEAATLALGDCEDRYSERQDLIEQLQREERSIDRLNQRIKTQQDVLEVSRAKADSARRAEHLVELQDKDVAICRLKADRADQVLQSRLEAQDRLAACTDELTTVERELQHEESRYHTLSAEMKAHQLRKATLDEALDALSAELKALDQKEQLDFLQEQYRTSLQRLEEAEQTEEQRRELTKQLDHLAIGEHEVHQLKALQEEISELHAQRRGGSLHLRLTSEYPIRLGEHDLTPEAPLQQVITERYSIALPNGLTLYLDPPNDSGDELAKDLRERTTRLAALCETAGVQSVADAEERLRAWKEVFAHQQRLASHLSLLAPDGLSPLRTSVGRLRRRIDQSQSAVAPLRSRQELNEDLDQRQQDSRSLTGTIDASMEQVKALKEGIARLHGKCRHLSEESGSLTAALQSQPSEASLLQTSKAEREAWSSALARLQSLRTRFEAAGGAHARRTLMEDQQALELLKERRNTAQQRVANLNHAIEHLSESSSFEAVQRARAHVQEYRHAYEAALKSAKATQRALKAVETAHEALQHQFAEPVKLAVQDGIQILFPGSELALDAEGDVIGLRTGGIVETFDRLSGGAREQFGVLARLGLARVLAGEQRLPVILDDALVNSDQERRSRMVEVLRRASQNLQILVFTCHEEDFDRLAPPWYREVRARPRRQ